MGIWEPSKSSTYEVAAPSRLIPLGEPGNKCAASARIEMYDWASVSIFGSLLVHFVNKGTSFV